MIINDHFSSAANYHLIYNMVKLYVDNKEQIDNLTLSQRLYCEGNADSNSVQNR